MTHDLGTVAAIIPVRRGSVGLLNKNMKELGGKPLLWYTARAAMEARKVIRTIVSTDCEKIAGYAADLGLETVMQPEYLSGDTAATFPVVRWVAEHLKQAGQAPDICVVLRVTTPFRTAFDIDSALSLLEDHPLADSVVSVVELSGAHPVRLKTICDGWLCDSFQPEGHVPQRRQELQPVFIRNGGIYAVKMPFVEAGAMWGEKCLPYVMPQLRSVNINTVDDFRLAECLWSAGLVKDRAVPLAPPRLAPAARPVRNRSELH